MKRRVFERSVQNTESFANFGFDTIHALPLLSGLPQSELYFNLLSKPWNLVVTNRSLPTQNLESTPFSSADTPDSPLVHATNSKHAIETFPPRSRNGRKRTGRRDQLVRCRIVVFRWKTLGRISSLLRVRLPPLLSPSLGCSSSTHNGPP